MTRCKHTKESIVIRFFPDLCHHQVEDGQGQPADKEDGHHGDQQPAGPDVLRKS